MDHLIHTLVTDVIWHYWNWHYCQNLKLEGSDLVEKRLKEIHAHTLEIDADGIRNLGEDRYYVPSVSNPSCMYLVELNRQKCDCPDWPRVKLCKHVTAVAHFFGRTVAAKDVEMVQPIQDCSEFPGAQTSTSAASIVEKMITVGQEFLSGGALTTPDNIRSLELAETQFTAAIYNSSPSAESLPDKEVIPPNQGNQDTWAETVQ